MKWKVALTIEARGDYEMFRLQKLVREKGFEPVFLGPLAGKARAARLMDCDAVIAGGDIYDAPLLETLRNQGRMKIIARFGVGYDQVDLEAASRFGIAVTNTAGTMAGPVAEMTAALLLSAARCVPFYDRMLRGRRWDVGPVGTSVHGKTVGLVGFGSIARGFMACMAGFGCRFLAFDPAVPPEEVRRLGAEPTPLEELAARSDFVSLHVPRTPETEGLWDQQMLRRMKPAAILINTSRGSIVREADLIEALRDGAIAGAGLDVFEQEPLPPDSPLLHLPNVVMTAHAAGWDDQTELVTGGRALENILDIAGGRVPRDILNADYAQAPGHR